MALVLLVEDEQLLRWGMKKQLEQHGHRVDEAASLQAAEALLRERRPEIVLLDLRLPDGNGLDFMAENQASLSESSVIVATASGQVDAAVRAMKLGAFDFLTKPVEGAELMKLIALALERRQERDAAERYRRESQSGPGPIVAESRAMKELVALARQVAPSPATTVLVTGETGTGKEVLSRFVHAESPRAMGPFLAVNCAALPEQLVESELFGHERGAFPDAREVRKGIFELAQDGTVMLDEVGELSPAIQAKLLRVLEERRIRRVGGVREIFVDVRVLAVSNRDLDSLARAGAFRKDLYHRLNVFPLSIPPLRERRDDIVPLAMHFVKLLATAAAKSFTAIAPSLRHRLLAHDWPGNARELRNLMERAVILEPGGEVTGRYLTRDSLGGSAEAPAELGAAPPGAEIVPLEEMELRMIRRAMESAGANQSAAARLLGITRDQLRYRLKRYREEGLWADAPHGDEEEAGGQGPGTPGG